MRLTRSLATCLAGAALMTVGCTSSDGDDADAGLLPDAGDKIPEPEAPPGGPEMGWIISPDTPVFESAALGTSITLTAESEQLVTHNADGSIDFELEGIVTVAGRGARNVLVFETFESVANGARQTLFTVDLETEEERFFHYEPEDNAVVIGDAEGGVFIFQNPDGSYEVVTALLDDPDEDAEFEFAADGYAAWQLVQQYNQFTETSDYSLLMAYGLAQSPAFEVRAQGEVCVRPACDDGLAHDTKQADPPAVCQTFKAFCDCIACQAAGVGEDCELCQAQ